MEVRTAIVADVPGIQRVASAAWHAAHDPIAGPEAVDEFLDDYYGTGRVEEHVTHDATAVLVAVDEDDAVHGFAMTGPVDDEPGMFSLGSIYVHPDRWGEGIGSQLLDRVEQVASDRGGTRLRLAVMAENERAVGFYESRGFERYDTGHDDRLDVERHWYAIDL